MELDLLTNDELKKFRIQLLEDIKKLLENKLKDSGPKWLRSHEVRKLLGISNGTLQSFRINGRLRPSKVGGIFFYSVEDIDKLLKSGDSQHVN